MVFFILVAIIPSPTQILELRQTNMNFYLRGSRFCFQTDLVIWIRLGFLLQPSECWHCRYAPPFLLRLKNKHQEKMAVFLLWLWEHKYRSLEMDHTGARDLLLHWLEKMDLFWYKGDRKQRKGREEGTGRKGTKKGVLCNQRILIFPSKIIFDRSRHV